MDHQYIGHRGWCGKAPENTWSAFSLALENPNIDVIECDAQLSKDGKLVVIHDFSVERTSNGKGSVRSQTYSELLKHDYGSWFSQDFSGEKIMLLSELLERIAGKKKLMLEVKLLEGDRQETADKVLDAIREYPRDMLMLESFNHEIVKEMKERDPSLFTGLIYYGLPTNLIEHVKYQNANFVSMNYATVSKEGVRLLRENNIDVVVWTMNADWQIDLLRDMRKDIYIASDYPNLARKWMEE